MVFWYEKSIASIYIRIWGSRKLILTTPFLTTPFLDRKMEKKYIVSLQAWWYTKVWFFGTRNRLQAFILRSGPRGSSFWPHPFLPHPFWVVKLKNIIILLQAWWYTVPCFFDTLNRLKAFILVFKHHEIQLWPRSFYTVEIFIEKSHNFLLWSSK